MLKRREITQDLVEEVSEEILSKSPKTRVEFLNSGLTLLNLALSGKGTEGGWARGRIVNIVGDGSSGKTLLALELAAQCFYNIKKVKSEIFETPKDIQIVYNNAESVMDFPLEEMYGEKFVDAVEWVRTPTIEAFGRDYGRRVIDLKKGSFLLYILDSYDSLTSEAGMERFEQAAKKDKAEDGSYGIEKAKYGSASFFNNICGLMEGKDATLVIISQVRENIGVMFGKKYSRSGGKALDFYTHQVAWLAEIEKLKKTFKGKTRPYGIRIRAKIERNKTAKPFRESELTILFDYGVDDVGSNISWLFGPEVKKIVWDGVEYSRNDLIKMIEENGLERELAEKVEKEWAHIEENIKPERKRKF
jgi:recombination protein RecA